MNWWLILDRLTILYTVVAAAGGWFLYLGSIIKSWWLRRKRLSELRQVAPETSVAMCVRIGGRSSPLPDVIAYLEKHQPNITQLFVYQAPNETNLDDPEVAMRIVEDLREAVAEYGKQRLTEVHLFPAGMIAYPFILGSLLANWTPVTVYHLKANEYVPLYRVSKEWLQTKKRNTRALAKFTLEKLGGRTLSET